jgi:hypothetical protein
MVALELAMALARLIIKPRLNGLYKRKESAMTMIGKRVMLNIVAGVALLGLTAAYASDDSGVGEPSWLFVQMATGGNYDEGTLTLTGVARSVAFTDRPDRSVGHIDNGDFAEIWSEGSNSFLDDPPNASLAYNESDKAGQLVLELHNIEVTEDSIVYEVDILDGEPPTADFAFATLVIDGYKGYKVCVIINMTPTC